jgi:hypothetical protein
MGTQRVHVEKPVPMDEDEVAHSNNPPIAPRALSLQTRGQRRRREPTEVDYLILGFGGEGLQMDPIT